MQTIRKRIFEIIEADSGTDLAGEIYDVFMMVIIVVSIIPLWTHRNLPVFNIIDKVTVTIFIIDYLLRLLTADFKLERGKVSFLVYPFTCMAIIDLLAILPSLTIIADCYRLLRIFRLIKTFKVFRIFKVFRYSKSITMIINVFKRQKESLLVVCGFAIAYIIISALIIFNAEPETFETMFDAIYWATISLTTVGYGDIYAVSDVGRFITMISAFLGIAIVALPAGIIIAGYQEELSKNQNVNGEENRL